MDVLNPHLYFVSELRWRLQAGVPLTTSIEEVLRLRNDSEFSKLKDWWRNRELGAEKLRKTNSGPHFILQVLELGLKGLPVQIRLQELENHLKSRVEADVERHHQQLPFRALAPLLLMQFPALMMLVVNWWMSALKGLL